MKAKVLSSTLHRRGRLDKLSNEIFDDTLNVHERDEWPPIMRSTEGKDCERVSNRLLAKCSGSLYNI